MNKTLVIIATLLIINNNLQGQNRYGLKTIKADINSNGIIDVIKPSNDKLTIKIDNKEYYLDYENDLGIVNLSELKYKNGVLTMSSDSQGTGLYSSIFKFRNNKLKNKIELIGYDNSSKWISGNMTSSINLATGKYEVIVMEWDEKKQDHDTKIHKGKKTFPKIYLTEIRQIDIDKLSEIGSKFEN